MLVKPDSKLQFRSSGVLEYEFFTTPKHLPYKDTMPLGQLGPPVDIDKIFMTPSNTTN